MNDAHFHLLLNHLPVILPLIGIVILIEGLLLNSQIVIKTAYFILIFAAMATIPMVATGEKAEKVVEKLNGVDEQLLKTNEEISETFAILCYVLSGIAIFGLWANFYRKSFSKIINFTIIAVCIFTLIFAEITSIAGGEMRHSEIRSIYAIKNI